MGENSWTPRPIIGHNLAYFELDSLLSGESELPLTYGGTQELSLRPGVSHAGETYIMLGSASGTLAGVPIPGTSLVVPLVPDAYTTFLLTSPGASNVMKGGIGVIDADGFAQS
ncbi:MAG: hypothetical protein ACI9D0_000881 [Bacteroidia bacterium]